MSLVPPPQNRPFAVGRWLAAAATAAAAVAATAALAQPAPAPTPPADFAVCGACHESSANGRPSLGPNLWNIGGRKAGATDFDYSPAMKGASIVWTADTLQAFILDPGKTVPGNKMDYMGASDAASAKAIADYLMSLKG